MMLRTLLLLVLGAASVSAQRVQDVPWEPGEGTVRLVAAQPAPPMSIIGMFSRSAVSWYHSTSSSHSVARCPFEISCSRFAVMALDRYGIAGVPLVLDRYFFRENAEAFSLYERKAVRNGVVKLDDALYLTPFE